MPLDMQRKMRRMAVGMAFQPEDRCRTDDGRQLRQPDDQEKSPEKTPHLESRINW